MNHDTSSQKPSSQTSKSAMLPRYAERLAAFHRAFEPELRAVVAALPLRPDMRVLDVGCGDGFYMSLLAERLGPKGCLTGLDINPAFIDVARQNVLLGAASCRTEFVIGKLSDLPALREQFDVVWCAQSLYSLPEPVSSLQQIASALRPRGLLAILENDTLHQLLLPWPSQLEISLRVAEYTALTQKSRRPEKFYIGRRLPATLAAAGLEPLGFQTQSIDRGFPLDRNLRQFLQLYLADLSERVHDHLDEETARELGELINPEAENYLLDDPFFTMSWLNVLAWGRTGRSGI